MSRERALAQLTRLRDRQRDAAQQRLAAARAEHAAFEQRRRGWRERLDAEAAAGGDDLRPLGRWLEASHAQERATAAEAERLRRAVVAAEEAYRAADLAVEQLATLQRQGEREARRKAQAQTQRRLDDLRRRPAFDAGGDGD